MEVFTYRSISTFIAYAKSLCATIARLFGSMRALLHAYLVGL